MQKTKKNIYLNIFLLLIKSGKFEELELAKIAALVKNKEMDSLKDFSFPYINQNNFNNTVFTVDTNTFLKLCFYYPIY